MIILTMTALRPDFEVDVSDGVRSAVNEAVRVVIQPEHVQGDFIDGVRVGTYHTGQRCQPDLSQLSRGEHVSILIPKSATIAIL